VRREVVAEILTEIAAQMRPSRIAAHIVAEIVTEIVVEIVAVSPGVMPGRRQGSMQRRLLDPTHLPILGRGVVEHLLGYCVPHVRGGVLRPGCMHLRPKRKPRGRSAIRHA